MKTVYVSTPYSHKDAEVRKFRFELVCKAIAGFMREHCKDYAFFSPIVHSHILVMTCLLPENHQFWMDQCLTLLEQFDEMWVVKFLGWNVSKGVAMEIALCQKLGIPVKYINWKE